MSKVLIMLLGTGGTTTLKTVFEIAKLLKTTNYSFFKSKISKSPEF